MTAIRGRGPVVALSAMVAGSSAVAWEFTPGQPCLLTHDTAAASIELTYDPTQPLYSVTIRRPTPFEPAAVFSMRFDGPAGREISTIDHRLSSDGLALTVIDRGFGNVLDGLQYNRTATAILGDQAVVFPLEGAEGPVAAFRACRGMPAA